MPPRPAQQPPPKPAAAATSSSASATSPNKRKTPSSAAEKASAESTGAADKGTGKAGRTTRSSEPPSKRAKPSELHVGPRGSQIGKKAKQQKQQQKRGEQQQQQEREDKREEDQEDEDDDDDEEEKDQVQVQEEEGEDEGEGDAPGSRSSSAGVSSSPSSSSSSAESSSQSPKKGAKKGSPKRGAQKANKKTPKETSSGSAAATSETGEQRVLSRCNFFEVFEGAAPDKVASRMVVEIRVTYWLEGESESTEGIVDSTVRSRAVWFNVPGDITLYNVARIAQIAGTPIDLTEKFQIWEASNLDNHASGGQPLPAKGPGTKLVLALHDAPDFKKYQPDSKSVMWPQVEDKLVPQLFVISQNVGGKLVTVSIGAGGCMAFKNPMSERTKALLPRCFGVVEAGGKFRGGAHLDKVNTELSQTQFAASQIKNKVPRTGELGAGIYMHNRPTSYYMRRSHVEMMEDIGAFLEPLEFKSNSVVRLFAR